MKTVGDIRWAQGDPPPVRGPWEAAICQCAEGGDDRFIRILRGHVAAGRMRSARARQIIAKIDGEAECAAATVAGR